MSATVGISLIALVAVLVGLGFLLTGGCPEMTPGVNQYRDRSPSSQRAPGVTPPGG